MSILYPDGAKMVPCFITPVKNKEEEAKLFERCNSNQLHVNKNDIFNSRQDRGDPQALRLKETVQSCGFDIDVKSTGNDWRVFTHISGLEWVYKKSARELCETLNLIKECWPDQTEIRQEGFVRGVYLFIASHRDGGGWFRPRIVEVFNKVAARTILRQITGLHTGYRAEAIARELTHFYNDNRVSKSHHKLRVEEIQKITRSQKFPNTNQQTKDK